MLKEIHEQPRAVADTLQERIANGRLLEAAFGVDAGRLRRRRSGAHRRLRHQLSRRRGRALLHRAARRLPCAVEIASEYRYRSPLVPPDTLFVTISQSGETADTLAALRLARQQRGYLATLAICNVPESSLVRESELVMLTRAGPEIGVASTKAFTTQLTALGMLVRRARAPQRRAMPSASAAGHAARSSCRR